MPFFTVLGFFILWAVVDYVETNRPQAPGVKDWDAYNRATIGMSESEIRKGIRQGKW